MMSRQPQHIEPFTQALNTSHREKTSPRRVSSKTCAAYPFLFVQQTVRLILKLLYPFLTPSQKICI